MSYLGLKGRYSTAQAVAKRRPGLQKSKKQVLKGRHRLQNDLISSLQDSHMSTYIPRPKRSEGLGCIITAFQA